jgi:protein involved in polysaccharide export with SLBB domain
MQILLRTLILAAALLAARPASAQPEPGRAELEGLRARWTEAARDPGLSAEARARAARDAEAVGARLREGDLRPGDQVEIVVEGEAPLTGTFPVSSRRELVLPGMDPVPLQGVLRAELEDRLREHVGRYVRHPVVHARATMRLAVLGQVRNPGFYAVPAESMVADLIMAAGGPLPTGDLGKARIARGGEEVWAGGELREAVQQGLTLDQMSLRSGDEVLVPERTPGRTATALRLATVVPAALLAVIGVARLF